jgi:hypothetical protein
MNVEKIVMDIHISNVPQHYSNKTVTEKLKKKFVIKKVRGKKGNSYRFCTFMNLSEKEKCLKQKFLV